MTQMPKVIVNYVAVLLLSCISAYYGHELAESLGGGEDCPIVAYAPQVSETGDESGIGSHRHRHDPFCDQWLCSGFSGVILATQASVLADSFRGQAPFADPEPGQVYSRAIDPPLDPPR